jgi:hypothetical protein
LQHVQRGSSGMGLGVWRALSMLIVAAPARLPLRRAHLLLDHFKG